MEEGDRQVWSGRQREAAAFKSKQQKETSWQKYVGDADVSLKGSGSTFPKEPSPWFLKIAGCLRLRVPDSPRAPRPAEAACAEPSAQRAESARPPRSRPAAALPISRLPAAPAGERTN